jgi:hypothetical protein
MSTYARLARYNSDALNSIFSTGSVPHAAGDFDLIPINIESTNPIGTLIDIPIKSPNYIQSQIDRLYDTKFNEFTDELTLTLQERLDLLLENVNGITESSIHELRVQAEELKEVDTNRTLQPELDELITSLYTNDLNIIKLSVARLSDKLENSNGSTSEIDGLRARISDLETQLDNSLSDANIQAACRQIVVDLRIQLGEGTKDSDFGTEFPFVLIGDE